MKKLEKLFSPKSIAIVGASPKREKLGNILVRNILGGGWKGKLYFVNPKYSRKRSEYYANLGELKRPVDLALVAIPAPMVNDILQEGALSKPKIENFVVISAGFSETGEKGKKIEDDLKMIAKKHQLNILGPNCLGFINTSENLNATFTDARVEKGKIAVVSQSGALEVALLDWAEEHKAGFSKAISIGNKSILGENEILSYLSKDKATGAVALYLEDIKDGAAFISATFGSGCQKPIAVIKAGKSKAGQKAIASHTGSLAQDENIVQAVFEKFGIIQAGSVEEFQDIISYLEYNKIPQKKEIIIVTNAGGLGVLAADFLGSSAGLRLLDIPEKTKKMLENILPVGASSGNPIDILGDAPPERYRAVIGILAKNFKHFPLLVLLTPQNQTNPLAVAKILGYYRKMFPSLSASFVGGTKIKKALEELEKKKIPNFESPERALAAIRGTFSQKNCRRDIFSSVARKKIHLKMKTNRILEKVKLEKRNLLFWNETRDIFREYKVALIEAQTAKQAKKVDFRKIKFPCVLKTDEPGIAHRWDKKAVALNIRNRKELETAWKKIKKATKATNFLVQPMAKPGLEMIIGMKRDRDFGPVIVAGWGGTFTEIFKDSVIFVPPLTAYGIRKKIERLEIYPVLKGYRGEKGYNIGEITEIVLALQRIAAENPDISQIDINPAILYNNGRHYQTLDAKIYL